MRAKLIHSEELTQYNFGAAHPMGPGRVRMAIELARQLGVLDLVDIVPAPPVDEDLLRLVHTDAYIAAVKAGVPQPQYGIGTPDNPVVPGLHHVAARICAATTEAARIVLAGQTNRAINMAGGLHHAMPELTSGFCVYNDCAIAIKWLQSQGVERIAYLDIDAHHGDGVQEVFYNDPGVLTISLHESPVHLFPGTGFAQEIGGKGAEGTAVNVALPPGVDDAGWLRAFDAIVPPVLAEFRPQILISQHGCDAHAADPLTDLSLSIDGQRASYQLVTEMAAKYCEDRLVATGGGGYALETVVPRAWAHLLAVVAGHPIPLDTPTPSSWRELMGPNAPATMGDGGTVTFDPVSWGYDPASRLDQAIIATRRSVFPELGLDPDF